VDCGTVLLIKMSGKRTIQDFFSSHKKQKKVKNRQRNHQQVQKLLKISLLALKYWLKAPKLYCTPDLQLESDVLSDSESDPGGDDEKSPEFNEWLLDKNKQSEKEKPSIHKQPPGPGDISQNVTDGPTQPILKLFPRTKFNDKFRQFNSSWYKLYPSWLAYSVLNDGAFCFVCRHFSVNPSQVFTSVGFKNWKRALEKESGFKQHETSSEHRNCHLKWIIVR
jgi:hypothetical protein